MPAVPPVLCLAVGSIQTTNQSSVFSAKNHHYNSVSWRALTNHYLEWELCVHSHKWISWFHVFLLKQMFFHLKVIKHYEVRPDPAGTIVEPITRTLLCPAKPINLQFLDRRAEQDQLRVSVWAGLVFTLRPPPVTEHLFREHSHDEDRPAGMHLKLWLHRHELNEDVIWCAVRITKLYVSCRYNYVNPAAAPPGVYLVSVSETCLSPHVSVSFIKSPQNN